jgi:glycosyltransferase involved in cell wall biosynthesis
VGDLPSVSIIMATRRPEFLARAIEQVNRQSYQPTELVLVLRDSAFPSSAEQQARELAGPPLTVIRASDELSLGEALNEGLAVSTGELITKMDDDDWYGVDHLWDLVLGLEYSGAEVIGKAAEFVYLEDLDLTVRRKIKGAEEAAPTVAGGAFMIPRHILRMFGGWPHLSVGEDFHLMSQIRSAGGTVYRTHGFGYILNRHSHGNTWQVDSSAFVKGARYQWPGLNKDQAGV